MSPTPRFSSMARRSYTARCIDSAYVLTTSHTATVTLSDVSQKLKRRTASFVNHFRCASHESAEPWLQTGVFVWNDLV